MIFNIFDKKSFEKKGYILTKSFYNKSKIKKIRDWIVLMEQNNFDLIKVQKYYEKSLIKNRNILVRIENFFDSNDDFFKDLIINKDLKSNLKLLFKDNPVLFKEKINLKPPGCREDKLHQDQAAGWSKYAREFITVMIAIDENKIENGAVHVSNSCFEKNKLISKEWEPISKCKITMKARKGFRILRLAPGDIVFFSSYIPHGSPPNRSIFKRRNIFLTFNKQKEGNHRKEYFIDKLKSYPGNKLTTARSEKSFKV
tara:strand:- start:1104 stop:1871 length:768 start_codon:yes stop_codon:yes gene_type:complete